YTSRGRDGAEALVTMLGSPPGRLRFVSGPVRSGAAGLVVQPACLVWEGKAGRIALQPWVEPRPAAAAGQPAGAPAAAAGRRGAPGGRVDRTPPGPAAGGVGRAVRPGVTAGRRPGRAPMAGVAAAGGGGRLHPAGGGGGRAGRGAGAEGPHAALGLAG